jgi:hypothetical protein
MVAVTLPSYAPRLNLQEQIWRWMRAEVTFPSLLEHHLATIL